MRMALQLRTKLRTVTNPCLVQLFSTSSSDPSDSSDPTEPNPQSHSSSVSDYFSDVKPSLKQQSPQQQQQQSRPIARNPSFFNTAHSRQAASIEEIRKKLLKFRRRSAGPNPTESNSAPGQRSSAATNPSQISCDKGVNFVGLRESLMRLREYEGDRRTTILYPDVEDEQTTLFSNQPSNISMIDQQDAKKKGTYEQWTKEESDLLLELMVEAATRGWRDNNGNLTRQTVEEKILPVLNEKLGCHKTFNNYQSRLKWFKNRWISYSTLMRFNSGFGFDSTTKKFIAIDEIWEEYFKAHPKDTNLRYGTFRDYEDLEIAIGNGVVGKNSIGLGNVTDARTLGVGESRDVRKEDFDYDVESDAFIRLNPNDPSFHSTSPLESPKTLEVPMQRTTQKKRNRTEYEGSSSSIGNSPQSDIIERLDQIFASFQGIYSLLEKKEREREYTIWDAIKDTPNLEEDTRFKAVELLDTKVKIDVFLKMSPKERSNWIHHKMRGL